MSFFLSLAFLLSIYYYSGLRLLERQARLGWYDMIFPARQDFESGRKHKEASWFPCRQFRGGFNIGVGTAGFRICEDDLSGELWDGRRQLGRSM